MRVVVVGLGYVGAVTAACLAELGHTVVGVDTDGIKVAAISAGESPIVEPKLGALIESGRDAGRLSASTSLAAALPGADAILVCVGTPARSDGTVDLSHVDRVMGEIGSLLPTTGTFTTVICRSTVPPGTVTSRLMPILEDASGLEPGGGFGIAMAPEFLREGSGVDDFFNPPFTVAGVDDERSLGVIEVLMGAVDGPIRRLSIDAAESLKWACNAFHAVKITFANEIGRTLKAMGVDAREVMEVFCEDDHLNISSAYLRPGFAFGGSCLPKDMRALVHLAREHDIEIPMIASVMRSNDTALQLATRKVLDLGVREIALLGLSFKAETDDLRESPFLGLAELLIGKGKRLRVFDPIVNPGRLTGANARYVQTHLPHIHEILVGSPEAALQECGVAIVATRHRGAVSALLASPPPRIVDLNGRLGAAIEALPGYEGVAW